MARIHSRIKPLVDIFRALPYVTVVTHDAGRYEIVEESGYKHTISNPLKLTFHVKDPYERKFEELIRGILARTSPPHNSVPASIYKRYYTKPEELPFLQWLWEIEIDPAQGVTGGYSVERWEEDVKNTMSIIVATVRGYIATEDL